MHKPLIALALAGLCLLPSNAHSQTAAPGLEVRGRVLDGITGAAVEGAVVELRDARRKAAADSSGVFWLHAVGPGMHHWVISRLGYAAWEEDMEIEDGDEFTIRLLPRPEVLEGITALVSRLAVRRNASGVTAHAIERAEIKLSASPDVADLVRTRFGLAGVPCPAVTGTEGERSCAWVRGELVQVAVFVDERRLPGGLSDLNFYVPQEVFTIETFYGGAMVRVITDIFAARLAKGDVSLLPLGY
jgi:hypothetical protein